MIQGGSGESVSVAAVAGDCFDAGAGDFGIANR
jgi:hypothetical protein